MKMMMIYMSCYIIQSYIFVLRVSLRTYSVRLSVHAVGDTNAVLSLVQLDLFMSVYDLLCVDCKQL